MGKLDYASIAAGALFILSLGYLGAETIFNMSLLDIAGSVRSSPADINHIQKFGRTVSAFGCYLLVLGLFVNSHFSIRAPREKRIFIAIAVLSIVPLFLILFTPVPKLGAQEAFFSALPLAGIFITYQSRRRMPFLLVPGLFLMVWSAVYTGQKLLIEEQLVDRTGWEERVNARYALMLRSGFEDCAMSLDDLKLCDSTDRQDIVKSARIILGALWMLNPEGIRRDMIDNREKLIEKVAVNGLGGKAAEGYQKYLEKVAAERQKYQDEMIEKYYKPYQQASALYAANADPEKTKQAAGKAADDIDMKLNDGWVRYSDAVRNYKQAAGSMALDAARSFMPWQQKLQNLCAGRKCPQVVNKNPSNLISQAREKSEQQFINQTGYTPHIQSREEFEGQPQNQTMIRAGIEEYIRTTMHINNFALPYNWQYSREGLEELFGNLAAIQVNGKWREKFGQVPPGLGPEDFFEKLGYPPLPTVKELAMDEKTFFDNILLPKYKSAAVKMFDEIEAEKHSYANGEAEEEKGRDFVRAAYIPAVSLVVSLIIVTMTIIRWMAAGVTLVLKEAKIKLPPAGRYGIVAVFVVMLISLPYLSPNSYITGTAYQRYLKGASAESPVMAGILDWAIHAQPVIYKFGTPLRKVLD